MAPPLFLARPTILLCVLLAALALFLSTQRLTTPPCYVFDELYYVYTAQHYVDGREAYATAALPRDDRALEWTNAPLANLIIAGGILTAGDNPIGWRLASVRFGVVGVCLTCLLGVGMSGRLAVGGGAAGLLLLDNLYSARWVRRAGGAGRCRLAPGKRLALGGGGLRNDGGRALPVVLSAQHRRHPDQPAACAAVVVACVALAACQHPGLVLQQPLLDVQATSKPGQ